MVYLFVEKRTRVYALLEEGYPSQYTAKKETFHNQQLQDHGGHSYDWLCAQLWHIIFYTA